MCCLLSCDLVTPSLVCYKNISAASSRVVPPAPCTRVCEKVVYRSRSDTFYDNIILVGTSMGLYVSALLRPAFRPPINRFVLFLVFCVLIISALGSNPSRHGLVSMTLISGLSESRDSRAPPCSPLQFTYFSAELLLQPLAVLSCARELGPFCFTSLASDRLCWWFLFGCLLCFLKHRPWVRYINFVRWSSLQAT